ncbi:MAG: hypothetical protein J6S14_15770 [Clostridia bacterium]|nr:hypothetical protein [Clostridia bacterium]
MYYSIYFYRHALSGIESQQADLLNAGHLEPMPPDHAWWFDIPAADVPRVLDYIFLAFKPMDVELFEQYTNGSDPYGELQRSICHIVDHRRYWTFDPACLEYLAGNLRKMSEPISDRQYYELLDNLHSANADGMPVGCFADLISKVLIPSLESLTVFELLKPLHDIYHHPENFEGYLDDPSTIPAPSRNYFDFRDTRKES